MSFGEASSEIAHHPVDDVELLLPGEVGLWHRAEIVPWVDASGDGVRCGQPQSARSISFAA
jgi:hypothetical protein